MRILSAVLFLAGALAALAVPQPAMAWGQYGHLTVCDLAYRNLTDTSRDKLKTLFAVKRVSAAAGERIYRAFNHACLEEDAKPRKHPKDHFINYRRDDLTPSNSACPTTASSCILEGIRRDLAIVRDDAAPPKQRAAALMAVGHWVGDVHQPLHLSFADDAGGNSIQATGACRKIKFHAVWDNCILERRIFARLKRERGWSKFTPTYRTVDRFRAMEAADAATIAAWRRSEPGDWAAESYRLTLAPEMGYCTIKAGACWYEDSRMVYGKKQPLRTIMITEDYLDRYEPVVELRLRQAGYRLAHLMNKALDPAYRS